MSSHDLSDEEDVKRLTEEKKMEDLIAKQKLEYFAFIKNLHGSYTLLRRNQNNFSVDSKDLFELAREAVTNGWKQSRQKIGPRKRVGLALLKDLDSTKGQYEFLFKPNFFNCDVINRDIS